MISCGSTSVWPTVATGTQQVARRVAYVPQRGGSELAFSVREVLQLGAHAGGNGGGFAGIVKALELGSLMERPVCDLSEGQRQRVTLGRALAQLACSAAPMSEKVLLADEPFSAMDPAHERSARRALTQLAAQGAAVCVVMHDLQRAAELGQRAVLLELPPAIPIPLLEFLIL
jgi:ABC-type hemin transport system ATPase subunit